MTFKFDKKLSRKFRQTDYKLDENWQEFTSARKRILLKSMLFMLITVAVMVFIARDDLLGNIGAIFAILSVEVMVIGIIETVTSKNDIRGCVSQAGMHIGDVITFMDSKMHYTFKYMENYGGESVEWVIPLNEFVNIYLVEKRNILVIYAGGTIVVKDSMNRVKQRTTYTTDSPERIEIPMVFAENEQLINELKKYHCVEVKKNETLDNI